MITIGLTGGISVGKSTLCGYWRGLGAHIINCDELAHESLKKGGSNHEVVVKWFGNEILDEAGNIDRKKLGAIVFNSAFDSSQLQLLNNVCHPSIRATWQSLLWQYRNEGRKVVVVEVPLLFEINVSSDFDRTVVLGCSRATQIQRMIGRGMDLYTIEKRIDALWPMEKKMEHADYVIWNDRDLTTLRRQASAIMNHVLSGEPDVTLL